MIVTVFWSREEILLVEFMKSGSTITRGVYCEMLTKLMIVIRKKPGGMLIKVIIFFNGNT